MTTNVVFCRCCVLGVISRPVCRSKKNHLSLQPSQSASSSLSTHLLGGLMQRLGAAAARCCSGSMQRLHAGRLMCDFHLLRDTRSNTLSLLPLRSAPRQCSLLLSLCCACCRVKAVEWNGDFSSTARSSSHSVWLRPKRRPSSATEHLWPCVASFRAAWLQATPPLCCSSVVGGTESSSSATAVVGTSSCLISLSSRQLPVTAQPASHWLLEANKNSRP